MSNRIRGVGVLLLLFVLAGWSAAAYAGNATGSDGGDTARVGVTSASSSPGSSRTPAAPYRDGGASGPSCIYVPVELAASAGFDLAPGGPTPGAWYFLKCGGPAGIDEVDWVPTEASAATPAAVIAHTPTAAAEQAAASIRLPSPSIQINPVAFSLVNLPTWLAINPDIWRVDQATATAGGVTATAVATPESVSWNMGDGGVVQCNGPGTHFNPNLAADLQSPSCSYTYRRSSESEPSSDGDPNDGAFTVTATVTWKVTWTAVGADGGGILPSLHTATTTTVRVEQIESVGVAQ